MKRVANNSLRKTPGAKAAGMPANIELQLATLRKSAPAGDNWIHEIKFDGYRMQCRIEAGKVGLITRGRHDWTNRFSHLVSDLLKLPVKSAWIDGEIAALGPDGISDFSTLQAAFRNKATNQLVYSVFDLLYLDGYDLRQCALSDRKRWLAMTLEGSAARVRYVDHVEGHGLEFFEQCGNMGLEGAVCKRADRGHEPGRDDDWIKVKCKRHEDFVICGYINPASRRKGVGSLILGAYGPDGALIYEGRVGSGISARVEAELLLKLARLSEMKAPFRQTPVRENREKFHWVRPELVARVEFQERTSDGLLRHTSFQGLRDDLAPSAIVRSQ
jgi:bifunctional non-homologous end joining protein LigD